MIETIGLNDIVYVCLACGKVTNDPYGNNHFNEGWDVSCFLNSVKAKKSHLVWGSGGQVIQILEGGIIEQNEGVENSKLQGRESKNIISR